MNITIMKLFIKVKLGCIKKNADLRLFLILKGIMNLFFQEFILKTKFRSKTSSVFK